MGSATAPAKLRIRLTDPADWPAHLDTLERHHALTPFASIRFSRTKVQGIMDRVDLTGRRRDLVLTAQWGERPIGLAYAKLGPYIMSDDELVVSAQAIVIDPQCPRFTAAKAFIRLLRGLDEWAKARSAAYVLVHNTAGAQFTGTHSLMQRWGAQPIGANYVKTASTD